MTITSGMTHQQLTARINLLSSEIEANDEENRTMQREIDKIHKIIDAESDKDAVLVLTPDAICAQDDQGKFCIHAGGHIIAAEQTELAAWFFARYLITAEERKGALRFIETCSDNQAYDVPKEVMKQLANKGFVTHLGGGWYEGTPLLNRLEELTECTSSEEGARS